MKFLLNAFLLISLLSAFACDTKKVERRVNSEFGALDKESNGIKIIVTVDYTLPEGYERKLERRYGQHYRDSFLLPVITSVSQNSLKNYSAGDIYSYNRKEIENLLQEEIGRALATKDIQMNAFFLRSVELPDELRKKLEKEHIEKFKDSLKKD